MGQNYILGKGKHLLEKYVLNLDAMFEMYHSITVCSDISGKHCDYCLHCEHTSLAFEDLLFVYVGHVIWKSYNGHILVNCADR